MATVNIKARVEGLNKRNKPHVIDFIKMSYTMGKRRKFGKFLDDGMNNVSGNLRDDIKESAFVMSKIHNLESMGIFAKKLFIEKYMEGYYSVSSDIITDDFIGDLYDYEVRKICSMKGLESGRSVKVLGP